MAKKALPDDIKKSRERRDNYIRDTWQGLDPKPSKRQFAEKVVKFPLSTVLRALSAIQKEQP